MVMISIISENNNNCDSSLSNISTYFSKKSTILILAMAISCKKWQEGFVMWNTMDIKQNHLHHRTTYITYICYNTEGTMGYII